MVATLCRFCSARWLDGSAPVTTAPEIVDSLIRLRPSEEPSERVSSGGGSGYFIFQRSRRQKIDLLPQRSRPIRFLWSRGVDLTRTKIFQSQMRTDKRIGTRGDSVHFTVGSFPDRTHDSLHSWTRKRKQLQQQQQVTLVTSAFEWRHPTTTASADDQTVPIIAAHKRRERRIGNFDHIETRSGWIAAGLRHRSCRARRRGRQVPTSLLFPIK